MKLSHLIGKTITNAFVKTKLNKKGLDWSNVYLEIEGKTIIRFPYDFEDINLKKRKPWFAVGLKGREVFYEIRNSKIVDFIMYDDSDSTGYFELDNGFVIYEITCFPSGAMQTGFRKLNSIDSLVEYRGTDYIRYSKKGS